MVVYGDRVITSHHHSGALDGEWQDVKELVSLEWTPCTLGESAPGSSAPGLREDGGWLSGTRRGGTSCASAAATSATSASARNKKDRALRRAQTIRKRLGGSTNTLDRSPRGPR